MQPRGFHNITRVRDVLISSDGLRLRELILLFLPIMVHVYVYTTSRFVYGSQGAGM